MKYSQLSLQQQQQVMAQAKKDYPSAFKPKKGASLQDKQYQNWLKTQALETTTKEMFDMVEA